MFGLFASLTSGRPWPSFLGERRKGSLVRPMTRRRSPRALFNRRKRPVGLQAVRSPHGGLRVARLQQSPGFVQGGWVGRCHQGISRCPRCSSARPSEVSRQPRTAVRLVNQGRGLEGLPGFLGQLQRAASQSLVHQRQEPARRLADRRIRSATIGDVAHRTEPPEVRNTKRRSGCFSLSGPAAVQLCERVCDAGRQVSWPLGPDPAGAGPAPRLCPQRTGDRSAIRRSLAVDRRSRVRCR